jgi:hypothetical protein
VSPQLLLELRQVAEYIGVSLPSDDDSLLGLVVQWLQDEGNADRVRFENAGIVFPCRTEEEPEVVQGDAQIVLEKVPLTSRRMLAVTSFSPKPSKIERQVDCVKTWLSAGLQVVAVQNKDEIDDLRKYFPAVEFVETDRNAMKVFNRPCVLVKDMARVIGERRQNGILINSDIEIHCDGFMEKIGTVNANEIRVGVRHNYRKRRDVCYEEPDGFDVFWLSPEMANDLPDLPLAIGVPFWDYWLPYHFIRRGFRVSIYDSPCFYHRYHTINWSDREYAKACRIIRRAYGDEHFTGQPFRRSLSRKPRPEADPWKILEPDGPEDVDFSMPQQPAIPSVIAVTALSLLPHHQEVQARCLQSWKAFGLEVACVQHPSEIGRLADQYQDVSYWIAKSDLGGMNRKTTQRINSLCNVAWQLSKPALVINSDIELHGDQLVLRGADPYQRTFFFGVRWNFDGDERWKAKREDFGLDAFLIAPEVAKKLPKMDFAIGKPMWDYWLPYHMQTLEYGMFAWGFPLLFHHNHPRLWGTDDWNMGAAWMSERYKLPPNHDWVAWRKTLPAPPPMDAIP